MDSYFMPLVNMICSLKTSTDVVYVYVLFFSFLLGGIRKRNSTVNDVISKLSGPKM